MNSCAEEVMDYCQSKGIGKVGETLFLAQAFNDERNEAIVFNDVMGGRYERRLAGIAFEHNFVDVLVHADSPSRCFTLLDKVRVCVEGIKGYISADKTLYESALAQAPPRLLMYSKESKYIYSVFFTVMRKTGRT